MFVFEKEDEEREREREREREESVTAVPAALKIGEKEGWRWLKREKASKSTPLYDFPHILFFDMVNFH